MTDQNISIEEKAQYIHASDEIVVYASNKQVVYNKNTNNTSSFLSAL